jgi:hypothetical protein
LAVGGSVGTAGTGMGMLMIRDSSSSSFSRRLSLN